MVRYLSEEEIAILKHEFDQYDADKGGNISIEEFGRVMRKSGQNPTDAELAQIIKEVDLDGDGTINFDEFIAMMTGTTRAPPPPATVTVKDEVFSEGLIPVVTDDSEADYKKAWSEFDHSLKGSITASQFRQVLANLGESITDVELDGIINSVDDEDKISYREFLEFMKTKHASGEDIIDGYGS